jgi:hypothetical protein
MYLYERNYQLLYSYPKTNICFNQAPCIQSESLGFKTLYIVWNSNKLENNVWELDLFQSLGEEKETYIMFRNVLFCSYLEFRTKTKSRSAVIMSVIHDRQKPFTFCLEVEFLSFHPNRFTRVQTSESRKCLFPHSNVDLTQAVS